VAPVPPGEPGVRQPRDGRPPGRRRLAELALAVLAAAIAVDVARDQGAVALGAAGEAATVLLVALGAFGLAGLAVVRVALPASLRGHELLWVPATGACVLALALGVLGFLFVPHAVAVGVVLVAGAVAARLALGRAGLPSARPARAHLWPAGLALLLVAVALVPMLRAGFATVVGNGSDAHLAVGSAQFLQEHHPLATAVGEPLDELFPLWRSKTPIYYAYAAVSTLSGLEPFEVISALTALLLALGALGFFLVARERLGAPVGVAAAAMVLAALTPVSLHSATHPYFNQLWGFMALPYVLLLARPGVEGERGARAMLALFTAVLALAYPLALPIGLAAVLTAWVRRRRAGGLPLRPRVRVWRGPRTLLWLVPAVVIAWIPFVGVVEKLEAATRVLLPGTDLGGWGGDLVGFYGWDFFLAVDRGAALVWAVPALLVGTVVALHRADPDVRAAFGAVLAVGLLAAVVFRLREGGWYFQFKALAFTAPLALTCAAVGLARLRWPGVVVLALWLGAAVTAAQGILGTTFDQTPRGILALRAVDARLPPGDSVRLDVPPDGRQLWVAFFLAGQPLCSVTPLSGTSYPHVPYSVAADWVLVPRGRRPADAVPGPPAMRAGDFDLHRRAGGGSDAACSQRMETIFD
jgi:hypothetical protein